MWAARDSMWSERRKLDSHSWKDKPPQCRQGCGMRGNFALALCPHPGLPRFQRLCLMFLSFLLGYWTLRQVAHSESPVKTHWTIDQIQRLSGLPLLPPCVHKAGHVVSAPYTSGEQMSCKFAALSTWSSGNQDSRGGCLRPQKQCGRVRKAAAGARQGAGPEQGAVWGALPAWRPGRGHREPRRHVRARDTGRAGPGGRGGCARAVAPACAAGRAATWVTAGLAFITAGRLAWAARPAAPRFVPRAPNGPATACQARGRHEDPALRPAAAPAAAAAAAAHAPRRGRRRHHRGKQPSAHLSTGYARLLRARGALAGMGRPRWGVGGPWEGRSQLRTPAPVAAWLTWKSAVLPKQRAAGTSDLPWRRRWPQTHPTTFITTFSLLLIPLSSCFLCFPLKMKEVSFRCSRVLFPDIPSLYFKIWETPSWNAQVQDENPQIPGVLILLSGSLLPCASSAETPWNNLVRGPVCILKSNVDASFWVLGFFGVSGSLGGWFPSDLRFSL